MTNTPGKSELLPCPFCGGDAERITIGEDEPNNAGGDVITCTRCQASSHVEFGRKENLVACWNTRAPSRPADQVPDMVERVARAIEKRPTDEPEMPGLSGHYPETEYHGAARYQVKCDCGFKTEPTNYYVAKAQWAAHAIAALQASGEE